MKRQLWFVTTLVLLAATACQRQTEPPNIVLVVVDTARADHWSCYGYAQSTTPRIDAFAAEAIRFKRAYSTSTWTLPAHASLFTGLYPATHQATQEHMQLDDRFETLAMLLQARGYATAAFSGNPWVSRATHLDRGFDVMKEMWGTPQAREDGTFPHATNRLIFDWLRRRSPRQPFFLFVNYIEPHFPYDAPPTYEARFVAPDVSAAERAEATIRWVDWYLHPQPFTPRVAALRTGLYDAELAYADDIVGELLAGLRQAGVYQDSLIVITSDHGENLGDHGHLDHVFSLYNSTLHVPLLIRRPRAQQGGTVREDPVQLKPMCSRRLRRPQAFTAITRAVLEETCSRAWRHRNPSSPSTTTRCKRSMCSHPVSEPAQHWTGFAAGCVRSRLRHGS
jgi:arylsulfatase A-like enzyme